MSPAKICTRERESCRRICSRSRIATEYASSPVEQPGVHTRRVPSSAATSTRRGITSLASTANASGSRKKCVTPMSRSRNNWSASLGPSRSRSMYAGTDGTWSTCMRSEEHTSELQSHSNISYAVFCLKKKKKKKKKTNSHYKYYKKKKHKI